MNVGACHTSSPADTTGLGQRRLAFNAQKVALALPMVASVVIPLQKES